MSLPRVGVAPQRGRQFEPGDDQPAAAGVAIISDSLWRRRYQADPGVIGRAIRLDNLPYTIVGVMPPNFKFPRSSELWIALTPALGAAGAASRGITILGRLAPGMTLAQTNAELSSRVLPARGSLSASTTG